jgi:hypothetical protein
LQFTAPTRNAGTEVPLNVTTTRRVAVRVTGWPPSIVCVTSIR